MIYSLATRYVFNWRSYISLLARARDAAPPLVTLAAGPLEALAQHPETVALMMPVSASHRRPSERKSPPGPLVQPRVEHRARLRNGASGAVILAHLTPDQRRQSLSNLSRRARDQIARDIQTVLQDGVL